MAHNSSGDKQYNYDVAISFLAKDEAIARRLDDLLKTRLKTFVYYDRQDVLAGSDGEKSFASVFGSDSRLSVVLYREEWGTTPFTRIEETAIRNRAFDDGYDFLTVVMLERDSSPPKWLPKNRIWFDYEAFGIERLVPVIEARVQEVGGEFQIESPATQADRLGRERDFAKRRESLLGSEKGVQMANDEVERLFADLSEETTAVHRTESGIRPSFTRHNTYSVRVELGAYFTDIEWRNTVINSLIKACLHVHTHKRDRNNYDMELVDDTVFQFDIQHDDRVGWTVFKGDCVFASSRQLAQRCVKSLLDHLEENPPW